MPEDKMNLGNEAQNATRRGNGRGTQGAWAQRLKVFWHATLTEFFCWLYPQRIFGAKSVDVGPRGRKRMEGIALVTDGAGWKEKETCFRWDGGVGKGAGFSFV